MAPVAVGPAISVTPFTANQSAVGVDSAGNFVVVWNQIDSLGDNAIYAHRYNAAGASIGGQFLITSTTGAAQFQSLAVAMDARGDFVVVWNNTYATSGWVSACSVNAANVSQGGVFRVSSQNTARSAAVAMDPAGDFVVTWFVGNPFGAGNPIGIFAQRYNSSALPSGNEFMVNTTGLFGPGAVISRATVAMDNLGDFVITWESNGVGLGVSARRFNMVGTPLGDEFSVFQSPLNVIDTFDPVVAMDKSGNFAIAWTHFASSFSSTRLLEVQRFNFYGIAVGGRLAIDSGQIGTARVVMDATGNFFVTWATTSGTVTKFLGQSYTFAATPIGTRVMSLKSTVVGMNASGAIVNTSVGSTAGVFAQRYSAANPLFNHPPVGAAKTVQTAKNKAYVFKVADFGFTDPNDVPSNSLLAVKIATLPLLGTLTDNGIAVKAGALISVADIIAGKLKFTPKLNGVGAAYASFTFQVQDNGGTKNGGSDLDTTARKMTISVT